MPLEIYFNTMFLYLVAIVIAAFCWANLEIQIEGKNGWAAGLPTWKIDRHFLLDLFYGGRPLTGYHVWAFLSVFFFFHLPFFVMQTWSFKLERMAVGGYALFWVMEDCFWFLLNPHFGLRKFNPQHVWWHKKWLLNLPVDYWVLGTLSAVLLYV
jgi:hypothetical protein